MKTFLILSQLILVAMASCTSKEKEEVENQVPTETWWINSAKVDCMGVGPMTCFQIQKSETLDHRNWELFYNEIEGFTYEPGNIYRVKVEITEKPKPVPADASSLSYKLLEVLSKEPDQRLALTNIWKVVSVGRFQDPKSFKSGNPLTFELNVSSGTYFGEMGCNTVRGSLEVLDHSSVFFGPGATTMMACPDMEVEIDMRKALEKIRKYKFDKGLLYLMDEEEKTLMMLQGVD
ncbi:DUF4377 domain-containing protein [Algoriphagus confluentis]|uniref:META domain-containing protein n=1 Tax=Algoriphagus confluentis TaxID=1697556 RepID=A0ABQ6PHZ6_9BACT|nr:hypothetical protein Aconfl_01540 [Algoriphagus confluentis]